MVSKILNNVKWGYASLKLLQDVYKIDDNYPVALLIRHSEREYGKDLSREGFYDLTPRGEKAAYEFGSSLPSHFHYRMYSSPSPRCKNTSRNIQAGIQKNGGTVELSGILTYIMDFRINSNELFNFIERDGRKYLIRWVSGFYPSEAMVPSIEVAMKTLKDIKRKLSTADSKNVDIHVSHDIYVAGTIFHLLGSLDPTYPVQYMDGLLIQIIDDQIHLYHKNGAEKVFPPFWWEDI